MEVMLTHVAGVDVHKEKLSIALLIGDFDEQPTFEMFECSTFTDDLIAAAHRILERGIKHIAMESTGIFWIPVFKIWSKMGLVVTLGNPSHMKNVPGRKTDLKDAQWIAQLHRNGLIRNSFIADEDFQELRNLCRHRKSLVHDSTTIKNRLIKVSLECQYKVCSCVC